MATLWKAVNHPFGVLWRTALVRLPRAVPDYILYYTTPEGPHPFVIHLPSRGKYEIPVYAFVPKSVPEGQPLPVILDFHGGGFFLGSCLEQAPFCAMLCRELGAVVLSVDYRLAPFDKFPAAIEDGEDVLGAILDPEKPGYKELRAAITAKIVYNAPKTEQTKIPTAPTIPADAESDKRVKFDTSRIAISGFSSGGNLALNLAISIPPTPPHTTNPWPSLFPTDHPHPVPLLLYYPSLDLTMLPSERTRPPKMPTTKSFWSDVSEALVPTYLPRDQAEQPRASPGLVDTRDGGLHPQAKMLLVLPELDTLAHQSEIWVNKVEEEGRAKDLTVERYPGMKHGWTQMPLSWLSEEEKKTREESFAHAIEFVRTIWEGKQDS